MIIVIIIIIVITTITITIIIIIFRSLIAIQLAEGVADLVHAVLRDAIDTMRLLAITLYISRLYNILLFNEFYCVNNNTTTNNNI